VPVVGGLLCLGAVTCWCVGSFATRWLPLPADPFVASVYEMLRRRPPAWRSSRWPGRDRRRGWCRTCPAKAWLGWPTCAVRVAGGLHGVHLAAAHAPISLVSTYAYVNPVIALLLGRLLVGEVLTGQVLVAAATVVVGVVLVVSTERG
jgi:drug/metabolite transporter (DMT)-like permease